MEVKYGKYVFVLMPPTNETSASIHIDLKTISDDEGLTIINRFLSALSWKCDQPAINHYGWSGNPIPIPVPKYHIPFGYSPMKYFPNEIFEIEDDKAKLAVALYREGRSLDSVPFKFLSFFKILNIFWKDQYVKGKNALIEELRRELGNMQDADCLKRIDEIKIIETDIAKYLYESGRCAIAHAYSDPVIDPDNIIDLHRLSKDMILIKTIAVKVIERELNMQQSLFC